MASMEPRRHIAGVVVSAGKMINTVKVRVPKQLWNKKVQKYYSAPETLLVSDPTNSTREGDLIALEGGRRISRHVRHVVAGVIAPMGPPMSERAPIPSAVERLAAVEAKRAAKDIRQAARGRWPAIVRVREREVKAATGEDAMIDKTPEVSLEQYVKTIRKRKDVNSDVWVQDFIRVAGYRVLQGELPLSAQTAALREAKNKLSKHAENMAQTLSSGIDLRTGNEISLHEREQISKKKLEVTQEVSQLERSISHFRNYLKELESSKERRQELAANPIEWFDFVTRGLRLNKWEQNVVALDLWGKAAVAKAEQLEVEDVLLRAGIAPAAKPVAPIAAIPEEILEEATPVIDAAMPVAEPIIDEAAIRASKIEEQSLARDASGIAEEFIALNINPEVAEELAQSDTKLEADLQSIIDEAGLDAQRSKAEELLAGDRQTPLAGNTMKVSPGETQREAFGKAQNVRDFGREHEAEIEAQRKGVKKEDFEVESEKTSKSTSLWGLFGGKK